MTDKEFLQYLNTNYRAFNFTHVDDISKTAVITFRNMKKFMEDYHEFRMAQIKEVEKAKPSVDSNEEITN